MTEPEISIEATGVEKTVLDLLGISERAGDIRPLSDRLRAVYLRSNERHWGSGSPELSESTQRRKQRQGYPDEIEVQSGALRKSLTEKRARGQRTRKKKDELRFGTSIWYARFQQGTKTQPPRDLIALSFSDLHEMNSIVERYIGEGHTE